MDDRELLGAWLDRWDASTERGELKDVDQFVMEVCHGGTPALVAEFRALVQRLRRVDPLVRRLAVTGEDLPKDLEGARKVTTDSPPDSD